ncbi:MAG TPA: S1 RNA-binding domain-containing protein, partial [Chryseolinea sp.]|nr:S1 RNA-binding domain-containing protein [Chryseolinea sp.]
DGVHAISDLKIGMRLPGLVTNVTNFGAFVDIGVHQDGLVHISHLSDNFVKDPQQVVSVQQKVSVTVVEVDVPRKRIGLSMKQDPFAQPEPHGRPSQVHEPKKGKPAHTDKRREKDKEKPKELSMEEKLAMLVNKFKK